MTFAINHRTLHGRRRSSDLLTADTRPRIRAFTTIELLVVIGILVLLIGIILPTIAKVRSTAKRAATGAQLQSLQSAIQAYFDDHKVYPPVPTYDSGTNAGRVIPGTGFASLGQCLLGVGGFLPGALNGSYAAGTEYGAGSQVSYSGQFYLAFKSPGAAVPTDATAWAPFTGADGLNGFGFKARRLFGPDSTIFTADDVVTGKTYGPYLSEQFASRGFALVDSNNNAILYYPATGQRLGSTQQYINNLTTSYADHNASFYNAADNALLPMTAMRSLMGDANGDGLINNGESPAYTGPYVLWAAGEDGIYGFNGSGKCDDITNFPLDR